MAPPLNWGIIGFGWVARDHMAPGIAAAGGRVAAVADPGAEAQAAAHAIGARVQPDAAALLADPAVEAVYVATPNHLHRAAVEACARANKPVLCEKPMAATLADSRAMHAACRAAGVPYRTAFDQRHHPAHAAMRHALRAGAVGTITAVRIVYACWLPSGFAPCAGHDNWRIDAARAGGGAAIDLAPHGIDLFRFLTGEPLSELHALTQSRVQPYAVDDGALLMGRAASGTLFQAHVAYNMPDALPRRRLEISGDRGLIVAENTMGQTPGGRATLIDADGRTEPLPFNADISPFAAQAAAFATAVRAGARDDGAADLADFELLSRALSAGQRHAHAA